MKWEPQTNAITICTCDHHAPPLRRLRQTDYCTDLARFYRDLGLSGPETVYWVQAQLFDFHEGRLFDFDGKLVDVKGDASLTDDIWREDERRTMLRFIDRASGEFRNLLQMRMVAPVMLLGFARDIHLCRTAGACAARAAR